MADDCIDDAGNGRPDVVSLHFEGDGLDAAQQARQIHASVRALELSFSNLTDLDSRDLLRILQACPADLSRLKLRCCDCDGINNSTFLTFAKGLQMLSNLKQLSIELTRCKHIEDEGLGYLASLFCKNLSYAELILVGCLRLTDKGLLAIAHVLPLGLGELHMTIRRCDLISDTGIIGLARELPANLHKVELQLSLLDLDPRIQAVAESGPAIREWQHILLLQDAVMQKPNDESCVAELAQHLSNNTSLIRQGVVETLGKIGEAAIPYVLQLAELLDDEDFEIWPVAARTLSMLGVTSLEHFLHDDSPTSSGHLAKSASSSLEPCLEDGSPVSASDASFTFSPKASSLSSFSDLIRTRIGSEAFDIRTRLKSEFAEITNLFGRSGFQSRRRSQTCASLEKGHDHSRNRMQTEPVEPLLRTTSAEELGSRARVHASTDGDRVRVHTDIGLVSLAREAKNRCRVRSEENLARALKCDDEKTRKSASKALKQLGLDLKPHAAILAERIADLDEETELRIAAIEALGLMGIVARMYAPIVAACMGHEDEDLRVMAARTLGRLGEAAAPHADMLAENLTLQDFDIDKSIVQVLGRLGAAAGHHAQLFSDCTKHPDWQVRWAAVDALGQLEQAAAHHTESIVDRLYDVELVGLYQIDVGVHIRESAQEALTKLPLEALSSIPLCKLARVVVDPDLGNSLRARATDAFTNFGKEQQVAALGIVLADEEWRVREEVVKALGGTEEAQASYAIIGCLNDPSINVRISAAEALLRLQLPDDGLNAPEWARVLASPHLHHRLTARAKEALHSFGDDVSVAGFIPLLKHEDCQLRKNALACLADIAKQSGQDSKRVVGKHSLALLDCLLDDDPSVRGAATSTLECLSTVFVQSPPRLEGHILVKSHKWMLALLPYRKRYAILSDGCLTWWESKDATEGSAQKRPVSWVDFSRDQCVLTESSDANNSQRVSLEPTAGKWNNGDADELSEGKDLCLDFSTSEFAAQAWTYALRHHVMYRQGFCDGYS